MKTSHSDEVKSTVRSGMLIAVLFCSFALYLAFVTGYRVAIYDFTREINQDIAVVRNRNKGLESIPIADFYEQKALIGIRERLSGKRRVEDE